MRPLRTFSGIPHGQNAVIPDEPVAHPRLRRGAGRAVSGAAVSPRACNVGQRGVGDVSVAFFENPLSWRQGGFRYALAQAFQCGWRLGVTD